MNPEDLTITISGEDYATAMNNSRSECAHPQVLDVRLVDGQIEVLRAVEVQNGWGCTIEFHKEWQKGGAK